MFWHGDPSFFTISVSMSGHKTRSTGTPKTGKSWISLSGHETQSTGTCIPEKLGSPCQDMKPGPQGKLMYYYFYHGSNLRKIIRFLCKIECIEFECNEFVIVLVQINLIHFEHSICVSSTWIKTNTNPLVQLNLKLIHIRYHTDLHIEVQIRILLKNK
jgi:hypothetical protein